MKKGFDFAKAYSRLEEITNQFASGNLSLEDSLKKFEEGLTLASECKDYLGHIENKIIDIKKKFSVSE